MAKRARQQTLPGFETEDELPVAQGAVLPAEPAPLLTEPAPMPPQPPAAQPPAAHLPVGTPPESLAGKVVWVIDSHSLIHQVFHAMPEMTGPRGEPIGAAFGFTRDLLYLIETKKPDYLFCAFDLPGGTFRHQLYDQYKAQRAAMHEDLVPQFPLIHRIVDALGLAQLACPQYEADDILATVARVTRELGGECFIVTADKDCRQLIGDRVKLFNIRKNQVLDREALKADWGIEPEQVVDYQSLVGDSVDNVPGVPLIGPKIAQQLLSQYGTLEAVLDHANEVQGAKRRENLVQFRDQALLSRKLVRLDDHAPIEIDWNAAPLARIDVAAVGEVFREFSFRKLGVQLDHILAGRAQGAAPREASTAGAVQADAAPPMTVVQRPHLEFPPPKYHLVDTPEKLARFAEELRRQTQISFDTETTDVRPRWAELVGASFSWNEEEAWYLPVRGPEGEPRLDLAAVIEVIKPVLENPAVGKTGQNLKYDMIVLRSLGIEVVGLAFDTMLADYLLEAGERNHNMDELAERYLGHTTIKISELIGTGKQQKRMDDVPVQQVSDYAAEDALIPVRLRPILQRELAAAELTSLFTDVELPVVDVLAEMEFNGISIDCDRLAELSVRCGRQMEELTEAIYVLAGRPLNIDSPKQLQQILFEELKLPVLKKTPKTGPSTDAEVLEDLAPLHPLPAKILEYRQLAKLKGTYIDALPRLVHPATQRVHTSFNQVVTATGRLSSNDPNLQNIPVRTELGREIRAAFVAGQPGWSLLSADYSQIELRVLAHYSGDANLCAAFARDEDVHTRVAAQIYSVPLEEVTKAMRREAKAVNFGVIYGQSPYGLAKALGIEQEAAAKFIDSYFAGYPGIEQFLDRVLADCRTRGYARTILGRRRAIRGLRENAGRQRNLAERTAVNTVIQGSAADLIKLAMIAIHRRLARERFPARMLLQIHDELVFEVPSEQLLSLASIVTEEMSGVQSLAVPLKVDVKAGSNWADAEGLKL